MSDEQKHTEGKERQKRQAIKCVVWDLDNTLWEGVLLEGEGATLRPHVLEAIQTLDSRGILNSIASRNDYAAAMERLQQLGVWNYFLYPQINWNAKSSSLQVIASALNLSLDTFAFVDDQPFELEEVTFALHTVLCLDARDIAQLPDMPEMQPRFITEDSARRRLMYRSNAQRDEAEKDFTGTSEEFLATLNMVFHLSLAEEADLQRAEELTVRTHQLNTTGYTYSYEELNAFRQSDTHKLLVASLDDKYGTYGKIGLALLECQSEVWTIKLFLMSCRVISRGVGTIMLDALMRLAREANVTLHAEFVSNDRNRMMFITYAFRGFKEIARTGEVSVLASDLSLARPFPPYVRVELDPRLWRQEMVDDSLAGSSSSL